MVRGMFRDRSNVKEKKHSQKAHGPKEHSQCVGDRVGGSSTCDLSERNKGREGQVVIPGCATGGDAGRAVGAGWGGSKSPRKSSSFPG